MVYEDIAYQRKAKIEFGAWLIFSYFHLACHLVCHAPGADEGHKWPLTKYAGIAFGIIGAV